MSIKVVVFDFDGTIADSYKVIVEITNRLSEEFDYKPLNQTELLRLKNLSSREIIKQSEIALIQIPFLLKRLKSELNKEIGQLKPIPGIEKYLFKLKDQGYQLGIITSNMKENVVDFLENNNLQILFNFIYSGISLFGKHKTINTLLRQNHLNTDEVIYIGDETRDIKAARKSNIKVIAVGWGFHDSSILFKHQPDFLIHHPQELIEIISSYK